MRHHLNYHQIVVPIFPTISHFAKLEGSLSFGNLSSDFLPSIIHELKTPLNAIIVFSDLLHNFGAKQSSLQNRDSQEHFSETSLLSPQDLAEYAKEISLAAAELNDLVNDLLDVSAVNSGNFLVNLEKEIDVLDVIKRSVKLNRDYGIARKVTIKTEFAAEIPPIKLDAKRMKQVITNLLSNAIKYSPPQTEIKISIAITPDNFLQISITDQGFGMTADQIQMAFIKYKTIPNPNSGTVDSFGLGLPIAKQLVESQGGSIEMKSEIGKGTQVVLKFPYLM